jgi:hypothetical protein
MVALPSRDGDRDRQSALHLERMPGGAAGDVTQGRESCHAGANHILVFVWAP